MRKQFVIPLALVLLLAAGAALVVGSDREAQAGFSKSKLSDLTKVATSDQALNLRLMALDALRKKTDSGVEAELEKIAKGDDAEIALYSLSALGKRKSSAAKAALRGLVTNDKLDASVRIGAMNVLAVRWKTASDLSWLQSATAEDSRLSSQCSWLKANVFGKQ